MILIPFSQLTDNQVKTFADKLLRASESEWHLPIGKFLTDWFNESISTIEIFTSGSTGKPKAVQHKKSAMLQSAKMTCEALRLFVKNRALLCLPADKIGGMMMILRAYYLKLDLYCVRPSLSPFQELPKDVHLHFAAFTPMQVNALTQTDNDWNFFQHIDKVLLGGETVSPALQEKLKSLSNEVFSTFGMTETISHIALKKLSGQHPETAYHTLRGVRVSCDSHNCLVVDAPALNVRHLVTNDVVEVSGADAFAWRGRTDNMINSGGVKLQAESIEQKLLPFLTLPFFIAAAPDPQSGEKPVLVIQATGLGERETQRLKEGIALLPKLEQPKDWYSTSDFLKTPTGKIKRKETLAQILQQSCPT